MSSQQENRTLFVGPSPHLRDAESVPRIMWSVVAALLPALIVAAYNFGWYAILVVAVSIIAAVGTEIACNKLRGVDLTIGDGSAVVTGMLLAYIIPPNVPLYIPIVGSIFAIGIAKEAFGGLGANIWNPALAGRAFLLAAYSGSIVMSKWPILKIPFTGFIGGADAVTMATPCAVLKNSPMVFSRYYSVLELFNGTHPGSLGETSALALLIGVAYLLIKKYINWRLPFAYILTVAIAVMIMPHANFPSLWEAGITWQLLHFALIHALSGGLIIGAFFMATDMVTSPLTSKGQIIYGVGCGVLVAIIRLYGGYPEGVCYSILIMNTAVWLIDMFTKPKRFGEVKNEKNA